MPSYPFDSCVNVDQSLHGYENGHRLLSSSVSFEPNDQRALLAMSDLSGPRVVEGFFEYLTGYPLPSKKFYAFAKTWYASEMERPGCVWTHTLLVKGEDVPRLQSAQEMVRLFRRPTRESSRSYANTIAARGEWMSLAEPIPGLKETMFKLYSQNDFAGTVPVDSGTEFEDLALQIWSQQWPELRMNFSFCTGALSERILNSRPLDLQFGPKRIVRNFGFRASRSDFEDGWISEVTQDLSASDSTGLRKFMWRAGKDLTQRTDLKNLAMIYHLYVTQGLARAIEAVRDAYPQRQHARSLKREICWGDEFGAISGEGPMLRSLVQMSDTEAFDSVDLEVKRRAVSLFKRDREGALDILVTASDLNTPLQVQYVMALVDQLDTGDFERLSRTKSRAISTVVGMCRDLTYMDKFWAADMPVEQKTGVFRAHKHDKSWQIGSVLESLLRTHNYEVAALAPSELDANQVEALLDWASQRGAEANALLRPEWLSYLRDNQSEVFEWFRKVNSIPVHMMIPAAQVLTPDSIKALRSSPPQSDKLLGAAFHAQSLFDERHEVAALAFAFAVESQDDRAGSIAAASFRVLHRAMGQSRLSHRAWQILEPLLPVLDQDPWDSCERLRRSLLYAFQKNPWPATYLWDVVKIDDELLSDMVMTTRRYAAGRPVFDKIFELIEAGQLVPSRKQAKLLRKIAP